MGGTVATLSGFRGIEALYTACLMRIVPLALLCSACAASVLLPGPGAGAAMPTMAVRGATGALLAVPQSAGSRWTLDFKPGDLRLYVHPESGRPYWYLTYMVVNRTGEDRLWAPRFEMLTDSGHIARSGRGVPSDVVRSLLRVLGSELVEDQNQVIGDLLQGPENAKEALVVWPADNLHPLRDTKEITIFVTGLSGETTTVEDPITGQEVVLAKTLQRRYASPGETLLQRTEPLPLQEESWVWR